MVNDSVGDALIRIKNGYMATKVMVSIPYSKLINGICELLVKEGYIQSAEISKKDILVKLKYTNHKPALLEVKRISKPGLRVYCGAKKIRRVLNGYGIAIISTPKGLLTDRDARKMKLGGEVMAEVW
ncbi:30S ribosomal protein S8 [Candidatus Daviesbacteria bacterium RIFCSPHIGHO2_12_FULL_37_11]|uniref:Small ribosomal subunit protein uS8 n=1 Tax=Candidatus Daviesbacteria bacterium RIFCSPHIGHO2_12_FULL_37_11 TaxID=1797777 RepID=A0A1F5KC98_9BACT|nr:MAG: 30S ribosomal protein S8 [Candidatus Daviesbacteria bacterium GWA1_38_6]OGE16458.1 MAG: 30S ribosomal protein S8 [Candidatus Daviesbacteria bacterium RIFCSPHIGHO2_01_FULL_37_27]OGE38553.1 MAG: 30S ribosomal protein S8 [Candidatus Daviesbacteria bacterium RIFCSPHIGHO2_12_FULL_37_11]OGE46264.1 MAG: 30S ribosomal protein S8 [Candidatus Daviesbacteria bacterium RIFCSPLOWO2_01_FULL_37_10]